MDSPDQFHVTSEQEGASAIRFARTAALIVVAGGAAALLGWHFNIPVLKQIGTQLPTMKANAAAGFVLAGAALLCFTYRATRIVARLLGVLLAALGGVTVGQDIWGFDLGIDQALFSEPPAVPFTSSPNRMSPVTAVSFVLLGGAFLAGKRGWLANALSDLLCLAVAMQALLVLVGYAYGVIALYYPFPYSATSLHGAVLLTLIAAGLFAASPERGIAAAVVDPSAGGQMIRRILPGLVAVPLLLGWLRHQGERAGYFDTAIGTALFAVSSAALLGGFAWLTAGAIRRADEARQRALRELQGQREWLSTTLASIGDAVIAADANGAVLVMNKLAEDLSGWALDQVRGRPIWEVFQVVDEGQQQAVEDPALKALRERRPVPNVQHILLTRDQRHVPVEASAAPIVHASGEVAGAVVIFRDITERRRAEQRQSMLVSELNHRVKNVLMIVHSLVQASARHASGVTAEEMARALSDRLQSLSRAHELLLETQWSGASLKLMVERELAPYARKGGPAIVIRGPDVLLPPHCTSVLAMTLHELATNAAKYGALAHPDGRLRVEWRLRSGNILHLIWSERPATPVGDEATTGGDAQTGVKAGFGMQLIDRGIRQNLGGETVIEFRKGGLHVEFRLPLAPDAAAAEAEPPPPETNGDRSS